MAAEQPFVHRARPEPADLLDDRKAQILRAIVEEYISTAQPVSSKTVVASEGLHVSPATVRNEMSTLERDGYISQPHTSAGRTPTDRGYRFFVDHFAPVAELPAQQRREVAEFFASAIRATDDLLHETSHLLSRITHHAAVVVGPQTEAARIRAVQLVQLAPRVILAVMVFGNGVVEKETVQFDHDLDVNDVDTAAKLMSKACVDTELASVVSPAIEMGTPLSEAASIAKATTDAMRSRSGNGPDPLFIGGASQLAVEQEAFASPSSVARLLGLLEQQVVVVSVMRELLGPGITVTIGKEHAREDLTECSLVLAPYLMEGAPAGTVGVLGPTRMDYRQAQAAVNTVSAQLSRELSR